MARLLEITTEVHYPTRELGACAVEWLIYTFKIGEHDNYKIFRVSLPNDIDYTEAFQCLGSAIEREVLRQNREKDESSAKVTD